MESYFKYYYFKKVVPEHICDRIVALGEQQIQIAKSQGVNTLARTGGTNSKADINENDKNVVAINDKTNEEVKNIKNKYVRDSDVVWFDEQWMYDQLNPLVNEANTKAGWNFQLDWNESIQFTKYGLNQFYGWHLDGAGCNFSAYKKPDSTIKKRSDGTFPAPYTSNENHWGKVRKLSVTINLVDGTEYEGGNLKFDFGPHFQGERFQEVTEIRPKGSMIVFPSMNYHQVTPVTKGTRYSLVMWCLGKPFK